MTNSSSILVSLLVLAAATCITCGVLEDFMSAGGLGGNSKGGAISGGIFGDTGLGRLTGAESKVEVDKYSAGGSAGGGAGAGGGKQTGTTKGHEVGKKSEGFLGCKTPDELLKLVLNPIEFVGRVVEHFGLEKGKFFEHISKGISFGFEIALQPALVTLKIIEKIFVPDACRLNFVCKIAKPLSFSKGVLPKLSTKFFEGSTMIKAFSDGLQGCDCDAVYSGCKGGEPKLKPAFETKGGHSSSGSPSSSSSYPSSSSSSGSAGSNVNLDELVNAFKGNNK